MLVLFSVSFVGGKKRDTALSSTSDSFVRVVLTLVCFVTVLVVQEAVEYGIIDEVVKTKTSHITKPAMPIL